MPDNSETKFLRMWEAAKYLGCCRESVGKYIRHGMYGVKLESVMVGGVIRTTAEMCDKFVEETTAAKKAITED